MTVDAERLEDVVGSPQERDSLSKEVSKTPER